MLQTETHSKKIESFQDLKAWQEAHKLLLLVYGLTDRFPKSEMYNLSAQLRRASVSVTSNIAEGFGRRSKKEKIQYYHQANGSLLEVISQLIAARDLKYITLQEFDDLLKVGQYSQALLQGLIKGASTRWN